MLEKNLEKKCVAYAKKKGFFQFKLYGLKGIPDRLFIKNGKFVFIEFKRPLRTPVLSPIQKVVINKLKKQKCDVQVVNDFDIFKKAIDFL